MSRATGSEVAREAMVQYYVDAFIDTIDTDEMYNQELREEIRKLIREVTIEFKGEEIK
jgi:aryl-alcohol dehydrogenase-like predicted oxidoreductase